jgi:hypothetical protein
MLPETKCLAAAGFFSNIVAQATLASSRKAGLLYRNYAF